MSGEHPISKSLDIIEARIREKLTVDSIAGSVHFSKNHYQRLFRDIVGESVMRYVTKRKLTLAGRALLETDTAMIDIALDYGFDSREGFTRSFKAYMGVSPTEYRKYGLAAIQQKTAKERKTVKYSQTTDEILRELNDFIAKAKETAALARKCRVGAYGPFWEAIAGKTELLADGTAAELTRITAIAEHPDTITDMLGIVKMLDDVAYQTNLVAFNAKLMIARATSEQAEAQAPLLQAYGELASASVLKARKITAFFNELSALIVEDMRKTAAAKIEKALQTGKAAAESIQNYAYIRYEVENITDVLSSTPAAEMSESLLDDLLFRLNIIAFTAELDAFRYPPHKAQFDGLSIFKESLEDACRFFGQLITPEKAPSLTTDARKLLSDIAFQGNMYLFYIRGEAEKLSAAKMDVSLDGACEKLDSFIHFARSAEGASAYRPAAERLCAVYDEMAAVADSLADKGGAVRFLAGELKGLAGALERWAEE